MPGRGLSWTAGLPVPGSSHCKKPQRELLIPKPWKSWPHIWRGDVKCDEQTACLDAQASSPYSALCNKKKGEEAGRCAGDMVTPERQAAWSLGLSEEGKSCVLHCCRGGKGSFCSCYCSLSFLALMRELSSSSLNLSSSGHTFFLWGVEGVN